MLAARGKIEDWILVLFFYEVKAIWKICLMCMLFQRKRKADINYDKLFVNLLKNKLSSLRVPVN